MSTKIKKKKNIFLGMGGVMPDHTQKNFLKYIFYKSISVMTRGHPHPHGKNFLK
jgi:hypothetical protein